uniref:Uncharacterized protein n=1 Tax=Spermophilus dauricus TaxID=99837 RepID=A0A8C9QG97_SPEDA
MTLDRSSKRPQHSDSGMRYVLPGGPVLMGTCEAFHDDHVVLFFLRTRKNLKGKSSFSICRKCTLMT